MRYLLSIFAVAALAATGCTKPKFACSSDAQCGGGARCDLAQSTPVCAIPQGACYPSCPSGNICVSGECKTATCTPECPANQVCDQNTATCKDVTVASVEITSPAANSFAGLQLQTTATARAPGGVNGVDFQVRSSTGAVLAHAAGVAVPAGSSNFAATVTLNTPGIVDGNANLVAVESYPAASPKESAPLPIKIDLTAPTVSLNGFDGRTFWLGPAKTSAKVSVKVADAASGVDTTKVKLTLLGGSGKSYGAVAESSDVFTFTVPVVDLGVANGAVASVAFKIDSSDLVGNASTSFTGHPEEALQVDLVKPSASITVDQTWYSASASVTVAGTAKDSESGLVGGAAQAVLTAGDASTKTLNQPGSLTASTFSVTANLSSLTFANTQEAAFPIHVTVTDNAGNAFTADGAINVDNKAPAISAVSITTTPDFHDGTANRDWFKPAASGSLTVHATIADAGAGVAVATGASATPCLTVPNDTTCYAGSLLTGDSKSGTYSFSLPRSAGTSTNGPVQYTITAQDTLAHSSNAVAQVYFDSSAPTITLTANGTWYARSGTITISATITDPGGSGVAAAAVPSTPITGPQMMVGSSGPYSGNNLAGTNVWQFSLDTTLATQSAEGPLQFTITAFDNVGNQRAVNDSRNIDDKAPSVAITSVSVPGDSSVSQGPVFYPSTTLSGTGYDGNHFLYRDSIQIQGTITDAGSGIAVSSGVTPTPSLRLDGILVAGAAGSAPGPLVAIADCSAGQQTTCNFTVSNLKLNDLSKVGAFNAADAALKLVLTAKDRAVLGDGTPAPHTNSTSAINVTVTRLWWKRSLPNASVVSGVAIHPSGDVIATTQAGTGNDTVFALYHDGPFDSASTLTTSGLHWSTGKNLYGLGTDLGSIEGPPAIGAGDGVSAKIYVATTGNDIVSFVDDASGTSVGRCGQAALGGFHSSPAIVTVPKLGAIANCEAAFSGADDSQLYGVCLNNPTSCVVDKIPMGSPSQVGSSLTSVSGSPTIYAGGKVYAGNSQRVAVSALDGTGNFTTAATFPNANVGPVTGLAFDGSKFYAGFATSSSTILAFDSSLTQALWRSDFTAGLLGSLVVEPNSAGLLASTNDLNLNSVSVVSNGGTPAGSPSVVSTFLKPSATPLLADDGRVYLGLHTGSSSGSVVAINDGSYTTSWAYTALGKPPDAPMTLDCSGVLYVAAGSTVFALLTDAGGLRPGTGGWPKYQRDSRNSGNADATTQWGVRTAPGPTGCAQ